MFNRLLATLAVALAAWVPAHQSWAQADPSDQQQAQGERTLGPEEMPMDQLALAQADTIKGAAVLNAGGERIGDIQDIVLDVKQGSAEFAVVGVGGFLGVGEKNVAVPWNRLTPAGKPQSFVLDVNRQTLEQAPAIDLENVAEMQGQDVRERISSFWRDVPQQAQTPRQPEPQRRPR